MLERSIGLWSGKTRSSWGHMYPLKLSVSTVVRIVGIFESLGGLGQPHDVIDQDLAIYVSYAEEHLRLMVYENHRAIVRGQETMDGSAWSNGFALGRHGAFSLS